VKQQDTKASGKDEFVVIPPYVSMPSDTIGDEEEMDSWENYEYNDYIPWWLDMDSGRDYDPSDPRDREQERDTRE
jgi:hypothetical protein